MRAILLLVIALIYITAAHGQQTASAVSGAMPEWQKAAGGKMEFEVASVKLDAGEFKPPTFALSADDSFGDTGGLFHADFWLSVYIEFAYKLWLSPEQRETMMRNLPKWTSTDRFLIQARAEGHPTKDQMRLMMQSLLQDRFGLRMHFQPQEAPVYAMELIKPGKTGPRLRPHAEGPPCDANPLPPDTFPGSCGLFGMRPLTNHQTLMGSRNAPMDLIASAIPSLGGVGRPVVDRTGLTGRYDFTVEFSMQATRAQTGSPDAQAEPSGRPFVQAAEEQLGIKLVPSRALLTVPVIDAVKLPSEN